MRLDRLHAWCVRHGYDYAFDVHRDLFLVAKKGLTLIVTVKEVAASGAGIDALLYAKSREERGPYDAP